MCYETLLYAVSDGIATVTLNQPKACNALDLQMRVELESAVLEIRNDEAVRVVILTGAGDAFWDWSAKPCRAPRRRARSATSGGGPSRRSCIGWRRSVQP